MNIPKIAADNTNTQQINYKGKFILSQKLSEQEAEVVRLINNTLLNKKKNNKIIKKLPFNITVSRSEKKLGLLELKTSFKSFFTEKEEDCFISFIHADGTQKEADILDFRSGLEWFNEYRQQHFGYNNMRQKLRIWMYFMFGM